MKKFYVGADGNPCCESFVDLDGHPVGRTPWTHPYSFDTYVLYKAKDFRGDDHMEYGDRMMSWDWEGFHNAIREVWSDGHGQMFDGDRPEELEKFLCLYHKHPLHLTAVLKGCNVSNGCPCWVFAFREVEG